MSRNDEKPDDEVDNDAIEVVSVSSNSQCGSLFSFS